MSKIKLSQVGAALDSDLISGGGTDDTATIQAALNLPAPLHIIVDGPALVTGLNVHGNTTIEGLEGGGFFLAPQSNRSILRNVNRSRATITDQNITVKNCFFNGNRANQTGLAILLPTLHSQESDGNFISGLEFAGVQNLKLIDVSVLQALSFSIHISNAFRVLLQDVTTDVGSPTGNLDCGQDGIHFNGPIQYVNASSLKIRSWDDGFAMNANDAFVADMTTQNLMGPYVGQGPITDISVCGLVFMNGQDGFRLMSADQLIDRVWITGTVGLLQNRRILYDNSGGVGNFGSQISIDLSKILVGASPPNPPSGTIYNRSNFSAPDGTALATYIPDVGSGWTIIQGSWSIQANKVQNSSGNANPIALVDAQHPDVNASATFTMPGSGAQIWGRCSPDGKNGIALVFDAAGTTLYRLDNGSAVAVSSTAPAVSSGVQHSVSVSFNASAISVSVDNGAIQLSATISQYSTNTNFGIGAYNTNTVVSFDNFVVAEVQ